MYHKVILAGYLGGDPVMRYTPNGTAVTNLSVATNDNFTNAQGEKVDRTTWFRVAVWGHMAEVVNQYLRKGRAVLVEGRLVADENGNPRVWTGQDGTSHASFEINASRVVFLPSREGNGGGVSELTGENATDDVPF